MDPMGYSESPNYSDGQNVNSGGDVAKTPNGRNKKNKLIYIFFNYFD